MKGLEDLKGKKFGLGSLDSAQAAIMPLFYLQQSALNLREMPLDSLNQKGTDDMLRIFRFNSDVGKHGDTGRSEFDVLDKIKSGELDAGAIGSTTWVRVMQEGNYPQMVNFYTSPDYCHCNFTTLKSFDSYLKRSFVEMMKSQNALKNDPKIAHMMSLEGLNEWVLCDQDALKGYEEIAQAMKEQHLLDIANY